MAYGNITTAGPEELQGSQLTKITTPTDKWSDSYALSVVKSDFAYAESYRSRAHDWRYRNASELYLAWVNQRYWDGTRTPRSSVPVYVVFEQVEAMLPQIVSAICEPESYYFYSERSDQADAALAWKRLVLNQQRETNWREQIRLMCKSSLIYGNGVGELGFEDYYQEDIEFTSANHVKTLAVIPHPIMGEIPVPMEMEEIYTRHVRRTKKSRPYFHYVSLLDFYVDPNCESTNLQDAGYVIKRAYMKAEALKELRKSKDFNIPDDATLAKMSQSKTTANQDVTKSVSEGFRGNMWNPSQDYTSDPAQKRIEVIEYTTNDRKVWLLNREGPAYNKPNRYGKINYYSMQYADVLDRWHALAISDVTEGEQRLQQGIINARVDELALSIHRPMVKRRGITIPAYQLRMRPGMVIEAENPDGDIKQLEVQNITQQAFIEVQASNIRTQQITGISDLTAVGAPTSGNSANRTATGVNTQAAATQSRMRYYIENAEHNTIEPMLNDWVLMNKKFLDMQEAAGWIKSDPNFRHLNPLDVMNALITVECRGSIKMAARMGFLQILPQMAPILFNPELLGLLAMQKNLTLNAQSLEFMLWDAIGYQPRSPLFVPMTEQEQMAKQQPPPAEKLKAMIAAKEDESNLKIHEEMNKTKMVTQILKDSFRQHGIMSQLDDANFQKMAEIALEEKRMQNEKETADAKEPSKQD